MALAPMTDKDKRDLAIAATDSFMKNQETIKNASPSVYADLYLDTFDLFLTKIEERERAKQAAFDRDPFGTLESQLNAQEKIGRLL